MSATTHARFGRITAALVLVAIIALLTGCGGSAGTPSGGGTPAPAATTGGAATPAAGGVAVTEQNFAFSPSTVSAKVGDTITFTNKDSANHEVKIDGQDLGSQAQGASVTWKATKAGSFPFSCVIHPNMTGTVTVQ